MGTVYASDHVSHDVTSTAAAEMIYYTCAYDIKGSIILVKVSAELVPFRNFRNIDVKRMKTMLVSFSKR